MTKLTREMIVIDYLRKAGPQKVRTILDELGGNRASLRVLIANMTTNGKLQTGTGKWGRVYRLPAEN